MGFNVSPQLRKKLLTLAGVSEEQSDATEEMAMRAIQGPNNKFGNVPVTHDDRYFQSTREGQRYLILKYDLIRGKITELRTQVPYEFVVNGKKIPQTYVADFVYLKDGETVVEDAKGVLTDLYKIKKALMLAVHGIEILET